MELSFGVTSHAKHAHSTGLLARRCLCSMLLNFVRKLNCHSETDDTRRSRRQRTGAKYLQAGSATAAGGGREPVTEVVVVEEVVVAAAGDELQVVAQVVRHATGRLVRCFEQAGEPAALRASGRSEDVGGRLVRSEAGRGEMEIDRCGQGRSIYLTPQLSSRWVLYARGGRSTWLQFPAASPSATGWWQRLAGGSERLGPAAQSRASRAGKVAPTARSIVFRRGVGFFFAPMLSGFGSASCRVPVHARRPAPRHPSQRRISPGAAPRVRGLTAVTRRVWCLVLFCINYVSIVFLHVQYYNLCVAVA